MDKYQKFEALLADPAKAEKLFEGSKQDVIAKLNDKGIDFSEEEFDEILEGMNAVLTEESDELSEVDLEDVAGGSQKTRDFGRKVGRNIRKLAKVVKWVVDIYETVTG